MQVHGEILNGSLNYAAGIFNGVADGGSGDFETADGDKDLAARLFAHPFRIMGQPACADWAWVLPEHLDIRKVSCVPMEDGEKVVLTRAQFAF